MTTQLEKLKQWSEETGIKLDTFYAIEILSDQFKLYGYFDNDITEQLYNLKFDCTLMTTGSIRLSNNNTIIYLS
jgi:hypothetical protein